MGGSTLLLQIALLSLSLLVLSTNCHNITDILSAFPEYSEFSSYLSQTKLDGEINSRTTVTVCVVNNGDISALAAKHPLSVVKRALSLLILLDYYDAKKLHQISDGTVITTTLYQTTGNAPGQVGSVNITDLKGGKVGFGSAAPGSALDSTYVKQVKQIPYNISVIEVSQPIIAPGLLTAPAPSASDLNLTAILEKAGCKTFASLLSSTGVLKVYQTAADKGLTVFAPNDEAFKDPKIPDLSKLSNAEVVSLLQFHALANYSPFGTLKTTTDPISTLATNGAGKYDLSVSTSGDEVTLETPLGSSRIASTVIDATPLCIFTVDNLLLPSELFGKAPSPAPGLEPVASPSPTPTVSPGPAPVSADAPSPPAPPTESPEGAPTEGPISSENSAADNAAGSVQTPAFFTAVLTMAATAIFSVLLS